MTAVSQRVVDATSKPNARTTRGFLIARHGLSIVDEQAYAHAAICRPQQGLGNQVSRLVSAEYVVLKVERTLSGIDHFRCAPSDFDSSRHHSKTGIAADSLHR